MPGLLAFALVALSGGPGPTPPDQEQDQAAEFTRPAEDRTVAGEERQRYFLIGPAERYAKEAPKDGFRLLLVLPGGSGSADFHPFVRRIAEHATGEEYLVAQLVAPVWAPAQARDKVWPCKGNPWPGMAFSTEEFLAAVVADVGREHRLDRDHVYALAWSSSGPAVYSATLQDKTPLTGVFLAMSVFHPQELSNLGRAKGMAYYLFQSPEDPVTPLAHAEAAKEALEKKKAVVELVQYAGGHRWVGDVYGDLRAGFAWLEEHHRKPRR